MSIQPHSPAWYDTLATTQAGYFYPWQSLLPPHHGEDVFLQMVEQHLSASSDVLEIACAQGELTMHVALRCRSIIGYDRVASWIARAQTLTAERGITNAKFQCHDSSIEANGGSARLPADGDACDLLICSKGPFHWVEDAKRVARRQGAVLLMLVPDSTPQTAWHGLLPDVFRWQIFERSDWARPTIEQRLALGGLALDSWWSNDVPEVFPGPEQLYVWLSWGKATDEVPPFAEMRPLLERIFHGYGHRKGVEVRRRRFIWKSMVTK